SLLLLSAGFAGAQPAITGGPVNAASFAILGLPNASIAQGSMVILFGRGLEPAMLASRSAFPLPTPLSGTCMRANVRCTTVNAIMIYTFGPQVAAILPSNIPTGDGTLTLTFNGQTSAPVPIRVVASSFGMLTRNIGGSGPAIAQNFNSQTDQPTN